MNLQGLNKQQVEESRQKHGANTLTQIPPEPLWKKILEGFKDPMIMILLVALVIQVVLCFMGEAHWYEPVGILIAIMIANGVSAISENQQEGKASALKAEEEAKEVAKVLRDGKLMEIHVSEVVVGDLVYLQAGDKISADGEIVQGLVKVDQATLNGETKEATKTVHEGLEHHLAVVGEGQPLLCLPRHGGVQRRSLHGGQGRRRQDAVWRIGAGSAGGYA